VSSARTAVIAGAVARYVGWGPAVAIYLVVAGLGFGHSFTAASSSTATRVGCIGGSWFFIFFLAGFVFFTAPFIGASAVVTILVFIANCTVAAFFLFGAGFFWFWFVFVFFPAA